MAVEILQKGPTPNHYESEVNDRTDAVDVGEGVEVMVQVFMVVQCFSCRAFQVHQVKKINKWVCKVCNEKQSVLKTYGKGTARDCRRHVQKLNMARGEKEKGGLRGSHPPRDYAHAFTTQNGRKKEAQEVEYPVVLADTKRSKWTTFIEPSKDEDEEEDDEYTTDKDVFTQASKTRRKARRSLSERKPRPLVVPDHVSPYSSVSQQMEAILDNRVTSSNSDVFHQDRYTKLDMPTHLHEQQTTGHSHSMFDLSSGSPSAGSPGNHKEWVSQIKQDLKQFSRAQGDDSGASPAREGEGSGVQGKTEQGSAIPRISSRWSQFVCEKDDSESEGEVGVLSAGNGRSGRRDTIS